VQIVPEGLVQRLVLAVRLLKRGLDGVERVQHVIPRRRINRATFRLLGEPLPVLALANGANRSPN
jgi:hypothetical protein